MNGRVGVQQVVLLDACQTSQQNFENVWCFIVQQHMHIYTHIV